MSKYWENNPIWISEAANPADINKIFKRNIIFISHPTKFFYLKPWFYNLIVAIIRKEKNIFSGLRDIFYVSIGEYR